MISIEQLNTHLNMIKSHYFSCVVPQQKVLSELHDWFMTYDTNIKLRNVDTYKQCVDNYFNSTNRVNIVQNTALIPWLFHCADECISTVQHKEFVYG
jgi:hypothetical protein